MAGVVKVPLVDYSGVLQEIAATDNLSINNLLEGYATTVTAAGTTTLTVSSTYQQYFTGATTQTVTMPVASTLTLGQSWYIVNNSSGIVTVKSSGANTIQAMTANTNLLITCILISGTGIASWNIEYASNGTFDYTQVLFSQVFS